MVINNINIDLFIFINKLANVDIANGKSTGVHMRGKEFFLFIFIFYVMMNSIKYGVI